jgi:hypothetical protein
VLAAGIGGAILRSGTRCGIPDDVSSMKADMTDTVRHDFDTACTPRREIARVSRQRVASWTGRSAVSSATDTALSRMATAGARKTRVSDLRDASAHAARHPVQGSPAAMGTATSQRRRSSGHPSVSG